MKEIEKVEFSSPEIICIGEALIDRLGPLGGDPAKDKPVQDCLGGAPANVACALAKLGGAVAFVGRLGDDSIGKSFRDLMSVRGVNLCGLQIDHDRPSRIVLVRRDLNGERSFQGFFGDQGGGFSDQAIALSQLTSAWPLLIQNARWLLSGSIPLASKASAEALLWSFEEAQKLGVRIALDINWRPTFWDSTFLPDSAPDRIAVQKISELIDKASLIKLAREEAIFFFNCDDPAVISKSLHSGPDVVITDGSKPVRWFIADLAGELAVLAPSAVIDTTGAGDAFMAGLLYQLMRVSSSLLDDSKIREIVTFAAGCGALVCGGAGAITPQPSNEEVLAFLSAHAGR